MFSLCHTFGCPEKCTWVNGGGLLQGFIYDPANGEFRRHKMWKKWINENSPTKESKAKWNSIDFPQIRRPKTSSSPGLFFDSQCLHVTCSAMLRVEWRVLLSASLRYHDQRRWMRIELNWIELNVFKKSLIHGKNLYANYKQKHTVKLYKLT